MVPGMPPEIDVRKLPLAAAVLLAAALLLPGVHIRVAGPRILGTADLAGDARPDLVVLRQGEAGGVLTVLAPR